MFRETFISHAHVDNDICSQYRDELIAKGIKIWMDLSDTQKGHSLTDDIIAHLTQSSALLVMTTSGSLGSYWVEYEIDTYLALRNGKTTRIINGQERIIIAIRLEPVAFPPTKLLGFTGIDAVGRPVTQVVDEIAQALRLKGADANSPTTPPHRTSAPAPIRPLRSSVPSTAGSTQFPSMPYRPAPVLGPIQPSSPTSLPPNYAIHPPVHQSTTQRLSSRLRNAFGKWMAVQWKMKHRFVVIAALLALIGTSFLWIWLVPVWLILENILLLFWLRLPKQPPASDNRLLALRLLARSWRSMSDLWRRGHRIWFILIAIIFLAGSFILVPAALLVIGLNAIFYPIKVALRTKSWQWLFSYMTLLLLVLGIIVGIIAAISSAQSSSYSDY